MNEKRRRIRTSRREDGKLKERERETIEKEKATEDSGVRRDRGVIENV